MACTFLISNRLDLCHPAELPEKAGLDETQIHVIEDQKFNSEAEALAACAKIEDGPRFIVAQALMPVIPAATLKAIEKFKASLPAMRDKLKVLLQEDPETGEPTWRKQIEAEIIERTKKRVCATVECDHCKSRIAHAYIETYLCPVCKTHPFMETDGDARELAKKQTKINELRGNVEEADLKVAQMEQDAIEASVAFKRSWLVVEKLDPNAPPVEAAPKAEAPQENPVEEVNAEETSTEETSGEPQEAAGEGQASSF